MARSALIAGAAVNFIIAFVHVGIVIAGPPAYLYFGTIDLAGLAAQGSPWPAVITMLLTLVFAGFGLYSLSGAGMVRPLPLLRWGLLAIGGIYFLRGLIVIPDIIRLVQGQATRLGRRSFRPSRC